MGAVAVAAGAAAIKLGKEVVAQFGELEQNLGGSEAVFGKYAASIQKTGEEAYKNLGVPQYYVEQSHEAIIASEEFEVVQGEIARRKELGRAYSDKAFHSKIICGDCGGFYSRKIWHSTDEYRKVVFQCNQKFINENRCQTPTLTEDEIKQRLTK